MVDCYLFLFGALSLTATLLLRLAQKQVRPVEDVERLQQLILRVGLSQDAAEVEELLLNLDEEESAP